MALSSQIEASRARRSANRARGERRPHARVRARPVVPGARLKITRRCLERRLLMAPGSEAEEVTNFYGYTLGAALQNNGVDLHAACQMGNHHHVDVTDVFGNLVSFKNSLHANLARGFNALRGRFDDFWSGGGSCDTHTPTDEESLRDLAYTDANPVLAELVKWGHQWPGFTTYGWKFGETRAFKIPKWYRDPNNPDNPTEVRITRIRPQIFVHLSDDELFERLMQEVRALEREKQAAMRREGRRFKGVEKLARQDWRRVPRTWDDRFKVEPKVAASDRWRVLGQLQRDRAWERKYCDAREAHHRGECPEFPYGTYWMRIHAGVRVAQGPP